MSSFQRAVIIPLDLYEKCQIGTDELDLLNPNLPIDVKLKLRHQQKKLKIDEIKKQGGEDKSNDSLKPVDLEETDENKFIAEIPETVRPFAKSILDFLRKKPEITWAPSGEITIENKTYYNSNITDLLLFILNQLVITSEKDIPEGGEHFFKFLEKSGLPKSWIKISKKRALRKRQTTLSGHGIPLHKKGPFFNWVTLK